MRFPGASVLIALLFGVSAHAGETIEIIKRKVTPICFILAHSAAVRSLQLVITDAEVESRIQCGQDAAFQSSSVSIETFQKGCGSVAVEVRGICFRP